MSSSSSESQEVRATSSNFEEEVPPKEKRKEPTESPFSSDSVQTKKPKSLELTDWWQTTVDAARRFLTVDLADPALKTLLEAPKTGSTVLLPSPPVGGLTSRFTNNMVNDKVPCIQRVAFTSLKSFIERKEGLTYVHGPQGTGKSFALYHLYCALSINPKNRVIYIADCWILNTDAYRELYKAIIAAFALDDEPFLRVTYQYTQKLDDEDWDDLLACIRCYCEDRGLTFYAIFDQHDGLKADQRTTEPTNFTLWPLDLPDAKIIISASANNDDTPIKMKDTDAAYWYREGYSSEELTAWQEYHKFFPEQDISFLKEYLDAVPFELYHLNETRLQNPKRNFQEIMDLYKQSRLLEMLASHDKFVDNLLQNTPLALKDTVLERYRKTLLCIRARVPFNDPLFDRQLFFDSPDLIVKPVIPLAMEVVEAKLDKGVNLERFVEDALKENFLNNSARGKVVESYIIQRVSNSRSIRLAAKQIQFTTEDKLFRSLHSAEQHIAVDNLTSVRFAGQAAPPSSPAQNTLYIPINSNYPDIDLFVWDHAKSYLWAIQVNVGKDPTRHSNEWADQESTLYQAWSAILPKNFSSQKVWITAVPPTNKAWAGQAYFDIRDQAHFTLDDFPALKVFKFQ